MACPICGKPTPCVHEQNRGASVARQSETKLSRSTQQSSLPALSVSNGEILERPEEKLWRQEVVSRVQKHRARRRRRFDARATLELDFQAGIESSPAEGARPQHRAVAKAEATKIIEFPRPAPPVYLSHERRQEAEDLELAEPIVDTPRILDAPEPPPQQMDLLPVFADIQLEAEASRRAAEMDMPPQPAPIGQRLFAGFVDMIVVLMASGVFGAGFVMFAHGLPQPKVSLLCGLVVSGSLWFIYQYLFLVYAPGTPGMQLAQLELCTFKGEPVSLPVRRWRALASVLSALAVGLGFAWALVDEDTLGWHDSMTQTYLRKSSR